MAIPQTPANIEGGFSKASGGAVVFSGGKEFEVPTGQEKKYATFIGKGKIGGKSNNKKNNNVNQSVATQEQLQELTNNNQSKTKQQLLQEEQKQSSNNSFLPTQREIISRQSLSSQERSIPSQSVFDEARRGGLFGIPTIGSLREVSINRAIAKKEFELQQTSFDELKQQANAGRKGLSFNETEQTISFDPKSINPLQAQAQALGRQLTTKERLTLVTGSLITGGTRVVASGKNFLPGYGGIISNDSKIENINIPFTDIPTPIKTIRDKPTKDELVLQQKPSDFLQKSVQIETAVIGLGFGSGGFISGFRSGGIKQSLKSGTTNIAEGVAPLRIKPGVYPDIPTSKDLSPTYLDVPNVGVGESKPFTGFRVAPEQEFAVLTKGFAKRTDNDISLSFGQQRAVGRAGVISRTGDFSIERFTTNTPFAGKQEKLLDTNLAFVSKETDKLLFSSSIPVKSFKSDIKTPFSNEKLAGVTFESDKLFGGFVGERKQITNFRITGKENFFDTKIRFSNDDLFIGLKPQDSSTTKVFRGKQKKNNLPTQKQVFNDVGVSVASVSTTKSISSNIKTTFSNIDAPLITGGTGKTKSAFVGKGLYEKNDFVSFTGQTFSNNGRIKQEEFVNLGVSLGTKQLFNQKDLGINKAQFKTFSSNTPTIRETTTFKFDTPTKLSSKAPLIPTNDLPITPIKPKFDFDYTPNRRTFFGGLPIIALDFPNFSGKAKKPKRNIRRTPSLVSFELGITSTKKNAFIGEISGLGIRPIIRNKRKRKKK